MAITIKKVSTKKELKQFIRFNYELYKSNPYSVPDLYDDMLKTFNKKKNAAFEFCEADYFLAYKNNKIVGRVAAIINQKANQTHFLACSPDTLQPHSSRSRANFWADSTQRSRLARNHRKALPTWVQRQNNRLRTLTSTVLLSFPRPGFPLH